MNFHVKPLSDVLGAEIIGLDLRKPMLPNIIEELFTLFHRHKVLVFRNQNSLTIEEQIHACKQFGEIEMHPLEAVPWGYREITYVTNTNYEGEIFEHCGPTFELWHSDTCYLPVPAKMSFLYAEKVPSYGGETLFADMHKAYNDLDPSIKKIVEGKNAVFGSGRNLMKRCQERGYDLKISEDDIQPDVIHPVIRTHPVTKNKSIFVNWTHTDCILDISTQESNELLNSIYNHCNKKEYLYTHYFLENDMIVWDNASTIHSNNDKKLTEARIMRRIMIRGTKPYYVK